MQLIICCICADQSTTAQHNYIVTYACTCTESCKILLLLHVSNVVCVVCKRGASGVCWARSLSDFAVELAAFSATKCHRPEMMSSAHLPRKDHADRDVMIFLAGICICMYIIFNPFTYLLSMIVMPCMAYAHVYTVGQPPPSCIM